MIRRALIAAAIVIATVGPAHAHPAPFSYLDLSISASGVSGSIVIHDLDAAHDPHGPEFDAWKWATPRELMEQIVPFKRAVYEKVLTEFKDVLSV